MNTYTTRELALQTGAELKGDPSLPISGVDSLEEASPLDASFLSNPRYLPQLLKSEAGLICVASTAALPLEKNYLISPDPSATFQKIATLFFPPLPPPTGIHSTAIIDPSASLGQGVSIGPYAVIEAGAVIGEGTFLGAHTYIGRNTQIGNHCTLHPSVVVRERCFIGHRVILQPGAVIGSCGFGYLPDAQGRFQKLEQIGIVILEDDVEIGANTTIDRARFKATIIHKGTKIDNLVQIAHNVEIGPHNAVAAQTGFAGSSKTGAHCLFGGQVGVLGHVTVADQVQIATRGGVSKSLKEAGAYRGSPAIPVSEYNRQEVHVRKLASYLERIKQLETRSTQGQAES